MPNAMGRSKRPPSLGKSAGARLMVMRRAGNSKPELRMALRTRSLLSLTAVSGKPTIDRPGRPLERWVSTKTWGADTPDFARVRTMARFITFPGYPLSARAGAWAPFIIHTRLIIQKRPSWSLIQKHSDSAQRNGLIRFYRLAQRA